MDTKIEQGTANNLTWFIRASTAVEFLIAFLVVIPLTLWLALARHSSKAEPTILVLFCLSFAWLNISLLRWRRRLRELGWKSPSKVSFGFGPRPEGAGELGIWHAGRHLCSSFVAVLLCMVAFGILKWLNGDY